MGILPAADLVAMRQELAAMKALLVQLVDIQLAALEIERQREQRGQEWLNQK